MYLKTTDLKDDFVQSKDDIYISHIEFLEDAESTDNIYISRIEFLEDAESKDDFNRYNDCWNAVAL